MRDKTILSRCAAAVGRRPPPLHRLTHRGSIKPAITSVNDIVADIGTTERTPMCADLKHSVIAAVLALHRTKTAMTRSQHFAAS